MEILKQYDIYQSNRSSNFNFDDIKGIIVIDEIDKHLHLKLQKEVLPELLKLFPHLQFIVSSHSPFFALGSAEILRERVRFLDLAINGAETPVEKIAEWDDVYQLVVGKNENYKSQLEELQKKITSNTKPVIVTEGKTDVTHIRTAISRMLIKDLDVDFYESNVTIGDTELLSLLKHLAQLPHTQRIIGIFDRDNPKIINEIGNLKEFGNNIYAFCIPSPNLRKNFTNVSIEFYYSDIELKKEKDGKALYFDNEVEFRQSASNKQDRILVKLDKKKEADETSKKVFDENIGDLEWIHSKTVFADLVANDADFSKDFSFDDFNLIFEKIRSIINLPQSTNE